jgi:AraC-like DNA-binding protein
MQTTKEELKSDLTNFLENTDENTQLNLIKSKIKAKPKDQFVMAFTENLETLMDKISTTDFKVLLRVCKYVSWGNVINLTQQTIANDLKMSQPQVARSFKKLENNEVFYKKNGSLFLNTQYLVKGDLHKAKDGEAYKLTKNAMYEELGKFIKDEKELQIKVHELMTF